VREQILGARALVLPSYQEAAKLAKLFQAAIARECIDKASGSAVSS
jgi:hypothetical protein